VQVSSGVHCRAVSRVVLLTGFPGFIGRRLVRALLAQDDGARIVALVEPRQLERAREVASAIGPERIELLPGDIADRDLGLEDTARERLEREVTEVFHLAAIYNLAVPLELAQRVNVDGTGNVLDLCARCRELTRLNYVSTAYVAGDRHGVVYEHELVLGQGFKNHYESTKFQAEAWVRVRMPDIPTTIYRPAIVVGDSQSGETEKFDGPYYVLRTIARAAERSGPIPQLGSDASPFNVVPVDFVVGALVAASADPEAAGETLHLVDPDPISAAELGRVLAREYVGREPSLHVPGALLSTSLRFRRMRDYFGGAPYESIRYLNHSVRFDTRKASELLARHGMAVPRFTDYAPNVVAFFREHEQDPSFVPPPAA
jgi:thioester reductase-like protein